MRKKKSRFSFKEFAQQLPAPERSVAVGLRRAFSVADDTPLVVDTDMGDVDRSFLVQMRDEDLKEVLPLMLEDAIVEHVRDEAGNVFGLDFLVMLLNARRKYSGNRRSFDSYSPEQCAAVLEWLKLVEAWPAEYCDDDLPGALQFWSERANKAVSPEHNP